MVGEVGNSKRLSTNLASKHSSSLISHHINNILNSVKLWCTQGLLIILAPTLFSILIMTKLFNFTSNLIYLLLMILILLYK